MALRPIVTLLAAGGIGEDAPMERVYPFAMAVDKLYDHTRDRVDIDLAITWLRRAAAHRGTAGRRPVAAGRLDFSARAAETEP